MYPLHKYLPTPFGTYLLYIDNGPTRVKVHKEHAQLPSYQTVKEYGRRGNFQNTQLGTKYQAFPKPIDTSKRAPSKPVTAPVAKHHLNHNQRKNDTFTPSSTMPHSIWSPKVKRMHLSYNMRQLRHTGQPIKDPPSKIVPIDAVTGAELKQNAHWYKCRSSTEHEGINTSPNFVPRSAVTDHNRQSSDYTRDIKIDAQAENVILSGKSRRPLVPPNTASNSPVVSEAYKRQASQLRNDMIPKRQKRSSRSGKSHSYGDYTGLVHRETQTTPHRFAKSSMECSDITTTPLTRAASNERSTSVPLGTPGGLRTKECMEMTGLPPILETDIPKAREQPAPRPAVTVESDGWGPRVRRVQEFRSASPKYPMPSRREYWEEMNKQRIANLPKSHNLLPFTWKEPKRFRSDENRAQQRQIEVDKILPMISSMPTVPRV